MPSASSSLKRSESILSLMFGMRLDISLNLLGPFNNTRIIKPDQRLPNKSNVASNLSISVAGKTFKYTEQGPVGLLTDKKAVHIQARGGVYSEGPAQENEFGDRYLKAILAFLGVASVESVIVEGMGQFPDKAEEIKQKAIKYAKDVAKRFAKTEILTV